YGRRPDPPDEKPSGRRGSCWLHPDQRQARYFRLLLRRPPADCPTPSSGASIAPTMKRRAFVTGLGAVLAAPLAVGAQQAGRIWRVGDLSTGAAEVALAATWASFVQGLRESGYVEGVTVTFERRSARGAPNRLPELASDLVRRNVDIIFARGPWA